MRGGPIEIVLCHGAYHASDASFKRRPNEDPTYNPTTAFRARAGDRPDLHRIGPNAVRALNPGRAYRVEAVVENMETRA